MNIPEKAVEAAWAAHDDNPEMDGVQAIVEAVYPYIAAQTLREQADALTLSYTGNLPIEYTNLNNDIVRIIRFRADEIEGKHD